MILGVTRCLPSSVLTQVLASGLFFVLLVESLDSQEYVTEAVRLFWGTSSIEVQSEAVDTLVAAGLPFETVERALRNGRSYSSKVPTGRLLRTRGNINGEEHSYVVFIPEDYEPSWRYPVHVYLHGGVMRPKRTDGSWWRQTEPFIRSDAIVVFPASWDGSIWWQVSQIENLRGLLNDLKRDYNVDQNRVYLLGMSDGATGAFYHAFKAPTPWAAFIAFHGHPGVLSNPATGVEGELYVTNLRNKPFFVVNGGRDRLYPLNSVLPFVEMFERGGGSVDFHPLPEAGHNMQWWPSLLPTINSFLEQTPRDPLPDQLSWQTEDTDMFGRLNWLVVNELGQVDGDNKLESINTLTRRLTNADLGIKFVSELSGQVGIQLFDVVEGSIADQAGIEEGDMVVSVDDVSMLDANALRNALLDFLPGDELSVVVKRDEEELFLRLRYPDSFMAQVRSAFENSKLSGRVDLSRNGNMVTVETDDVKSYTLLVSTDQFDLSNPIRVVTNGVVSHDGLVQADLRTLFKWAAIDQDPSQLFAAELTIDVSGR